jgi:hypothetical protein
MPLKAHDNLYRGVNAHLHSLFQAKGGWASFHTQHIGHLAEAINALLPAGYLVDVEQSLQLKEIHPDTGERLLRPEPDLTVYATSATTGKPHTSDGPAATLILPLLQTVELTEDVYFPAVLIYETREDAILGRPLTRIELFSPSNKFGGGAWLYREKRLAALSSGLRLVEIDYLHETEPHALGFPSYPRQHPDAFAYNAIISDPTPTLEAGHTWFYGFGVDEPMPILPIPLLGSEAIQVDMGAVYRRTFGSLAAYSHRVDYALLPERFERYRADDQARIRAVMARAAVASGGE